MAVPSGDERDFRFAKYFNIDITNILGDKFNGDEANPTKDAELVNSNFLTGMLMRDAIKVIIDNIESLGYGKAKVNYKMRDAAFSRQRYWGEPFPIVWRNGIAYPLSESELPLELPDVENYKPGPEGEGPLANVKEWVQVPASSVIDLTPNPSPKERGALGSTPGYVTSTPDQWKILSVYAKENRRNKTDAEDKLWQVLRNRQIAGCKFRRQHPIAGYIPDFVCLERKLIVEIDVEYHNEEEQRKFDKARAEWLNEHHYKLIRFTNDEVINDIDVVVKKIGAVLNLINDTDDFNFPSSLERELEGEVALRETNTMPGYAGSSWYFLRYMDPHNHDEFCDKKASDYWNQVDVYVGGTEHAVGHLLYSRMWTKFLFDLGLISFDEPYKRLLNQGMIQGSSRFVYRVHGSGKFVSAGLKSNYETDTLRVDVNIVDGTELDIEAFKKWRNNEHADAEFILEDGKYICGTEVEKMSKSKFNTVDPSDLVDKYGADTFRMYEMFLGPVEQSKPWDTKGIEGVHRFLRKFWRLFYDEIKGKIWNEEKATDAELKILHKAIKKIEEDTERFSYNTAVSAFMVCTNELADLKCNKKEILEPLVIMLSSYAPYIAEELFHALGNETSVLDAAYPILNSSYLVESSKQYPISVNGKLRTTLNISLEASQNEVEEIVLGNDVIKKWLDGKAPKKVIFVKNKMVNVVV